MAGDWIKMTLTLDTDPSVISIACALSLDELSVVGKLWKVWAWADTHSISGNAVRVTETFIDRITHCEGFAKAMRDAGWLTGCDHALSFPNFDRHNGKTAKSRALTKERVIKSRNANTVTKALPEKIREEKNKKTEASPRALEVLESWEAAGFEAIRTLTAKRVNHLKARLESKFWSENWKAALRIIQASDFCQGKNDRGWKANIDWFIRSDDAVAMALEGKYGGAPVLRIKPLAGPAEYEPKLIP